jgi:hypothetical protein
MNATLDFQRGPLIALLALFFLALMAALAPPGTDGAPTWLTDSLQPPLADMERASAAR